MSSIYHVPVLGNEICEALIDKKSGIYYDGTLGGGGHAELILNRINDDAVYIGVDQDQDAINFAGKRLAKFGNVVFYNGRFDEFDSALNAAGVEKVDAILLDLGVSSYQIDEDQRGFSFRKGLKLDMRMDIKNSVTAETILATYSEEDLSRVFFKYGEERFSRRIARLIVGERQTKPINNTDKLINIINRCVPGKLKVKSHARIFQALRIEVNQELSVLENALNKSVQYINKGGRIAVISYHSLEDRIVKNFLREQENPCVCPPEIPYCVCGRKPQMKRVKPALIVPGDKESGENPRARSAKLRIGEKL